MQRFELAVGDVRVTIATPRQAPFDEAIASSIARFVGAVAARLHEDRARYSRGAGAARRVSPLAASGGV